MGTAYDITLTASSSAHTKGSWVTIIDPIPYNVQALILVSDQCTAPLCLTDFGLGAAGSEQVIIPNVPVQIGNLAIEHMCPCLIPLSLPSGQRLAGRAQASVGLEVVTWNVILIGGGYSNIMGLGRVVNYGAVTGTSRGTSIDPGGTANTKGAYTQIVASSSRPIKWLCVCLCGQANLSPASALWQIDIAVGAAASEVIVAHDLLMAADAGGADTFKPAFYSFPCYIPSGTRISARAKCTSTDATDRLFDIVLLGVD